ncbi:MAG: phosphotransferase [Acidimicrobiia bacterium]
MIARVASKSKRGVADREVTVARRLQEVGAPIAPLDSRFDPVVHGEGDFIVTLWARCAAVSPVDIAPREYADALARLHEGMRRIDTGARWPVHVSDRVGEARALVDDLATAPEMAAADRQLVSAILRDAGTVVGSQSSCEQLLHGEPHRDNLMRTDDGLVFFDFETCCVGPVEFDIAHATTPDGALLAEVGERYPGADRELVRTCWRLTLALAIAWRCEPGDDLPDGPARTRDWTRQLRADLEAS